MNDESGFSSQPGPVLFLWRMLVLAAALIWAPVSVAVCLEDRQLRGVNLAGAEFNSKNLPGEMHRNYTYPKASDLDYFAARGANAIRLPIRWERVQRELMQPLEDSDLSEIRKTLAHARDRNMCLVLDLHNYGTYHKNVIGSEAVPEKAFIDLWKRLVASLESSEHLALGLMNEPFRMSLADWGQLAQRTVADLRSAGADHLIVVSGGRWSGVHEWRKTFGGTSNAEVFAELSDPRDRTVLEVHQYADEYYSGTKQECHEPGHFNTMFGSISDWARQNDQQLFLGEFGVPASPTCLAALDRILSLVHDPDVWRGWTYWAAGGWWGDYFLSIHPRNGEDAGQMAVVEPYFRGTDCSRIQSDTCPNPPSDIRIGDEE